MKHKIVDDKLETIETGTFRQACEREILSLVIRPLRKKYKKKILIQWPTETNSGRNISFTEAYIFILPRGALQLADLILDYKNNNLRIYHYGDFIITKEIITTKEIPMANPHGHEEAFEHISTIIDNVHHKRNETKV